MYKPQYVASLFVHWLKFLPPKGEMKLKFVIWSYSYLSGPQCWGCNMMSQQPTLLKEYAMTKSSNIQKNP